MRWSEDLEDSTHGGWRMVARPEALEHVRALVAEHGSLHAAAAAGSAATFSGRGTPHLLPTPLGDWVVRHYRRGGLVGRLVHDRYLRLGLARPLRELRVSDAARARGVPTPRVMAALVEARRLSYRGDIAVERVPDSADLAAVLFGRASLAGAAGAADAADGGDVWSNASADLAMRAAGRLIRLLHERGLAHPDLNLKNILLEAADGAPRAWILDLDRATVTSGPVSGRARARMLKRFRRSLGKWERATDRPLPPAVRAALDAGYAEGPPG